MPSFLSTIPIKIWIELRIRTITGKQLQITILFEQILIVHVTIPCKLKVMQQYQFTGTWVTRDGFIRKEHFPDGQFDETDNTGRTITGQYTLKGRKISYQSKKEDRIEAEFINGIIYESGRIFYPEACAIACLEKQVLMF